MTIYFWAMERGPPETITTTTNYIYVVHVSGDDKKNTHKHQLNLEQNSTDIPVT